LRDELADYLRRLRKIEADPEMDWVKSIRIGGSHSRGEADNVADLDVFFVVSSEYYHLETMLALARYFGSYVVLDIPRESESWGIWITGFFYEFGYVDIMIRSEAGPLVSYMTDPSSIVVFDRTGDTRRQVASSGEHQTPKAELVRGHSARAWLRLYIAAKALKRGQVLQFRIYLWEALESVVALRRLSDGIHPPGRNYEHAMRAVEVDVPEYGRRASIITELSLSDKGAGLKQIKLVCDWLMAELDSSDRGTLEDAGIRPNGLGVLDGLIRGMFVSE